MTPLIREMVNFNEVPEIYSWFDVGDALAEFKEFKDDVDSLNNALKKSVYLPFKNTAIVGDFFSQGTFAFFLEMSPSGMIRAEGALLQKNLKGHAQMEAFVYLADESGAIKIIAKENTKLSKTERREFLAWISICIDRIHEQSHAFIPTASKSSSANARRIAKGKKPIYEWRTVTIDSPSLKSPHLVGSHASPRHHQRRGHWRNLRSGKKVWVRNASVGNAALGTVFHDYQVKNLDREAKA